MVWGVSPPTGKESELDDEACLSHYLTAGSMTLTATRPHRTPTDPAFRRGGEGATALSLARLFFMRGFVVLPLYRCSPPVWYTVCLSALFLLCPGFGFYFWVRGARFGVTTDIGLLEEF